VSVLVVMGGVVSVVVAWTAVLVRRERVARRARFHVLAAHVASIQARSFVPRSAVPPQAAPPSAAGRRVEWVPPAPPERVGTHSTSTGQRARAAS